MGAWGHLLFENDFACDTMGNLKHSGNPAQFVFETIFNYEDTDEYIEDDECQDILIAVLLLLGFTDRKYIDERAEAKTIPEYQHEQILKFIDDDKAKFAELLAKDANKGVYNVAYKIFDLVFNPQLCETAELRSEGDDDEHWKKSVEPLKTDIAAIVEEKKA